MPGGTTASFSLVDQAVDQMKKLDAYITEGMDTTVEITNDLLDYDKDTSEDKLNEMRDVMLQYIKMEQDLKQFTEAVDFVKQQAKKGEGVGGNLEDLLDEKLGELKQTTIDRDIMSHEKFVDLQARIVTLQAEEGDLSVAVETEDVDPDAEVAIAQQTLVTKCPYTGKEMKDPVRNVHCGHSYEREGITRLMKTRHGKAKCPVTGCINDKTLEPRDLRDHPELKLILEERRRHAKRGKKT